MHASGFSQEDMFMATAEPWEDLRRKLVEALKRSPLYSV
jgi:hypothetical protein